MIYRINIIFISTKQEILEIQLKENYTLQFIFNYYYLSSLKPAPLSISIIRDSEKAEWNSLINF